MAHFIRIAVIIITLTGFSGCNNSRILKTIKVSEVNLSVVTNGTYHGSYQLNLPFGYFVGQSSAIVDVVVTNNRFQSIHLINMPEWISTNKGTKIPQLLNRILEEQKLNVDAASGASYTVKAVQKAIENAFSNTLINN